MDYPTFIETFSEFADQTKYPVNSFNFYLSLGEDTVDPCRWLDRADLGTALYIAHHLVLEARAIRLANYGGLPGLTEGPVVGKGVGGVSKAQDAGAVTIDGDGHWNMTDYGIRFMALCRIVGAGGIQLL